MPGLGSSEIKLPEGFSLPKSLCLSAILFMNKFLISSVLMLIMPLSASKPTDITTLRRLTTSCRKRPNERRAIIYLVILILPQVLIVLERGPILLHRIKLIPNEVLQLATIKGTQVLFRISVGSKLKICKMSRKMNRKGTSSRCKQKWQN